MKNCTANIFAVVVPLAYAVLYAPYGMDTTDFGFFYGYPWRLLQGEVPYRDFYYITPPLSLYLHALRLAVTPDGAAILAGKLCFFVEMLAAAWMGAFFLARVFDFDRLRLSLPLVATLGFVWGVHSFPPMPWHTIDGVFFGSAALLAGIAGPPFLAGLLAGLCALTKQSYILVPLAVLVVVFFCRSRGVRKSCFCLCGIAALFLLHYVSLRYLDAWEAFRTLTTGQLDQDEALKAGILIYIAQNPYLPALACIPLCFVRLRGKGTLPFPVQPVPLYFFLLSSVYIYDVWDQKGWIGFGDSWPTLFMVVGGICVLFPAFFMRAYVHADLEGRASPALRSSIALGAALFLAWSAGISGGYKIPAFFALPLMFSALLAHKRAGGEAFKAAWLMLACGLVIFRVGYEYPYVFPVRPMPRSSLIHDAGQVYPKASGVYVDAELLAKLRDLRDLRERYGSKYKTLPGFPLAYFLNNDPPVYPSEWLMDWWIGGEVEKAYQLLVERDIIVFMERDQADAVAPDAYASRRYSVPARVRALWRVTDETEHFIVLRKP